MLTDDQVEAFIGDKLGIWDWKEHLTASKFEFLTILYRRYRQVMYFQNVTMVTKPPEERHGPTIEDIISQVADGPGGVCIHMNFFMKMLLEHLGYDVHPVGGKCLAVDLPDNHVFLLVHIPRTDDADESSDGDMYLVDVGFPWPINGPINLKQLPYEYKAGGFKIRYEFNEDENIYQRVFIGGDAINCEFENENEERINLNFDLKPREFEDFGQTMNTIFSDPDKSFFLNTTLLFRYITLEDENNFEYVSCLGRKIIVGTATARQIHNYETYSEMIPVLLKYFPKFKEEELLEACEVYQNKH